MTEIVAARQPFVNGEWIVGRGQSLSVQSPATEETVAQVDATSQEQVFDAISAARGAFDDGVWSNLSPSARVAHIRRFLDALETRRSILVETVIQEAGCPRMITELVQVGMALSSISELANLYEQLPEWEYNELPLGQHLAGRSLRLSIRRFEPAGVVAAITPYNFPFITNIWKVIPALLAGCTVVLRPSPLTPLEATVMGEAAREAELPRGVLNVVVEAGNEGAVVLTTDPRVDVVSFTGSTAVGRTVAAQAAPTLKRVILELGGKSPAIHLLDVFDSGVESVVGSALSVFVSHAGQGCALQTRVIVPEELRRDVVDALAAAAGALRIGDPSEPATVVGPLITRLQRKRVDDLVKQSVAEGARCVIGGRAPADFDRGWYYEPTVLDAPDPYNAANQNEFFGPVVSILGYRDLDEAIRIANASEYGLSGGIYTGDLALGLQLANQIRSGTVQVNVGLSAGFTPMGGYKQSGYGRERGAAGIRSFQELKHVVVGNR